MHNANKTKPTWGQGTVAVFQTKQTLTAAVALARSGIPVFPCIPLGKQPLTRRGFHDASCNPGQITAWWRRWPDANLAMPTGQASGVDVVDVDVHVAGDGFAAFERAHNRGLVDGWAWIVRTPSGGMNAAFLRTNDHEQRSWQVPSAHVDFRGDGGYIVLPPSRVATEGGHACPYELIEVARIEPRPVDARALRAFLDPSRKTRPPRTQPARGSRPDKLADWVAGLQEGNRNHGLFWAACRMAEGGHPCDAALSTLGDAARAAGLTDRETATTVQSAYRIVFRSAQPTRLGPSGSNEAVGA